MVTTSNPRIWDVILSFKDHGKAFDNVYRNDHPPGFRWLHNRFGSNFRLTELQSAIGRRQLEILPQWHSLRASNAELLIKSLSDCNIVRIPLPGDNYRHAWYKFHFYIRQEALASGWTRDRIVSEICASGFPIFHGSCSEIYLEKCFKEAGLAPSNRLPVAREIGETILMCLVHPTITSEQMEAYCAVIRDVLLSASR